MRKPYRRCHHDWMYMIVTPDRYELIIAFGDSAREAGQGIGSSAETIWSKEYKDRKTPVGAPNNGQEQYRVRRIPLSELEGIT